MAREMVCELGMSESLGRLAWGQQVGSQFLGGDAHKADYSDAMAAEIDREVRRITDEAYSLAAQVLQANRVTLDRLAAYLVERETVREPELSELTADIVGLEVGALGDGVGDIKVTEGMAAAGPVQQIG